MKGKIIVISAPSGTGKTTICRALLKRMKNLKYSISTTTRPKRKGEVDGRDYFFITEDDFKEKIKSEYFVEWEKVHNYYYGTSKEYIRKITQSGYSCLLDVDVKGSQNLKKMFPDGLTIFLAPPSWKELERRLRKRKTETEKEMALRLSNAREEMKYQKYFDHTVVNRRIPDTINKIVEIIKNNI
ncbi:MAG: guanylate kinase [Spirochaetes bacterium]|nr:guanylate kinase [Spirochaetota bacterium]